MKPERCDPVTGHCITCGDEGIVMRVIELRDDEAVCADELRTRHRVAIDLVGPVAVGDEVLVHAGVAIGHLRAAAIVGARE
ncbi:MAG TPA: HypC/HybG/HupF family hydrogenase formation chaperone [Solirubrobacteraceae bacterium]|nr:HypC/HybG/HupF family hydrogenase formation chaperone [Solirubrobacteraceae bacterium]